MNTLRENTVPIPVSIEKLMKYPWIVDILEWTFKYDDASKKDKLPYNTTFFEQVGGVSYAYWSSWSIKGDVLIDRVKEKISSWQYRLIEERNSLKGTDEKSEIEREWLDYIIQTLEMAKIAVPIELEKSSKIPLMTDAERVNQVKEMDKYQSIVYGWKLSENLSEIHSTLSLMRHEWQEGKRYLSESEKEDYTKIYSELIECLERAYPEEGFEGALEHAEYIDTSNPEIKKLENITMHRGVYIKLWRMFIASNWLEQRVVTSSQVSSIYDSPDSLLVPKSKTYEEKDMLSILKLMIHEIGVHYINQKITEDAGFIYRWARNLEKEEGLAILCEWLLEWKWLPEIKRAGYSFPYILVGELLWKDSRQKLANIRVKISKKGNGIDGDHSRDLRIMRGYPLDSLWAQRKDMSYGRGLLKIIHHIESGEFSLTDFFAGKFSIEDIVSWRIDRIIPRENRLFPLLFPEMLLYMLIHGRDDFSQEKFVAYISEKYKEVLKPEEIASIETIQEFTKLKVFINMWRILEKYKKSTTPPHLPFSIPN